MEDQLKEKKIVKNKLEKEKLPQIREKIKQNQKDLEILEKNKKHFEDGMQIHERHLNMLISDGEIHKKMIQAINPNFKISDISEKIGDKISKQ